MATAASRGETPTTPPSVLAARTIVQALVTAGVEHFVLCPGSRSAPLAYALYDAERAGAARLHVRTDERAAAFTALGVGKATGMPAVVVTTSGTAVANVHPAAAEAQMSHVPLIAVTADRPDELRGTWANQTHLDQAALLAATTKLAHDIDASTADLGDLSEITANSVAVARGIVVPDGPGAVHLNVAFSEPLLGGEPWIPAAVAHADKRDPWTLQDKPDLSGIGLVRKYHQRWQADQPMITADTAAPTVVVAGDDAGPTARDFAEQWNLPLFAEPSSGALPSSNAVLGYRLYLESQAIANTIKKVILFGRPTLSRPITRLLHRCDVVHVAAPWQWPAPTPRLGSYKRTTMPLLCSVPGSEDWITTWRDYDSKARQISRALAEDSSELTGPIVASAVMAATHDDAALVCGASNAIRDLDLAPGGTFSSRQIYANRGLAGIDGTIATARGIALTGPRIVRVLLGDLTFLHDVGALASASSETPETPVQVVVLNDRGGRIFSRLEYGSQDSDALDRVFTTAVGFDAAALCEGFGVSHNVVRTREVLEQVLADPKDGISVVEIPIDPQLNDAWNQRLAAAVLRPSLH